MCARASATYRAPVAIILILLGWLVVVVRGQAGQARAPLPDEHESGEAPRTAQAPGQPEVRVGVYWWDAWWEGSPYIREPLTSEFAEREPVYGWRSDSQPVMDQTLEWLASHHIDFIDFLWYERGAWRFAEGPPSDRMNTGLHLYLSSRLKSKVAFCLMWTQPVAADHLDQVLTEWLSYFADPQYVRMEGQPVLYIYSDALDGTVGGDEGLRAQIIRIREAVNQAGLPGLYLVAAHWNNQQTARYRSLGIDASTSYVQLTNDPGATPYSRLVEHNRMTWDAAPADMPYIPNVTSGWDGRPRQSFMAGYSTWYEGRTPELLCDYVLSALQWITEHRDRTPPEPLLTIYAWNEVDEGGYLVPTKSEGTALIDAVRDAIETHRAAPVGRGFHPAPPRRGASPERSRRVEAPPLSTGEAARPAQRATPQVLRFRSEWPRQPLLRLQAQ